MEDFTLERNYYVWKEYGKKFTCVSRFNIHTGEKSYERNVRKPSLIVQVLQNTEKFTLERSLINVRNVEKPLLVPRTLLYI